jgi:hypothetical protein
MARLAFRLGRVQNLPIGVKKAKVSCAVAHSLNAKKHSELLVDVFASGYYEMNDNVLYHL